MAQYRMLLEYDGTEYHGWQLQPDTRTLQGVLETALATVLRHPVRVAASGRTDAGVHALGQVATFRTDRPVDPRDLRRSVNALTPPDLAVKEIAPAAESFDVRRHATARVYEYRIWTEPWRSAFWHRFTWHVPRPLDVAAMRFAAAALVGEHDFSAFRAADCEADRPVRRVVSSGFTAAEGLCVYRVEANAFLKHMVRAIVGTMVEVGTGRRPAEDVARVLASRSRMRAGRTAPPHGLVLMSVRYG
ncbi:MAG: tRNA pseudouridine(38-40) synthase TruA [Polyangiaceae bacterium UTPRO1]|jgi:tRNA pseudouridine38-40 synthase|nr:tRNA pseudouridine(38-40) synthase TruA [Myxococcales bacterium]OQY68680.1 MAG: tRNA pseudouridine(38-40) synthase TruA [Polyangiaceae bacterium UTPRO1]